MAVATVFMLAAAVGDAASQAKPNFGGKWTLVPDPGATGGRGRGGFGLGQTFAATQDEKNLTVVSTTAMGEVKAIYNLDGSESKNPVIFDGNTVDRVSRTKWDGQKLVITTKVTVQEISIESTQVWALGGDGMLTVETTTNAQGQPTTSVAKYKKG